MPVTAMRDQVSAAVAAFCEATERRFGSTGLTAEPVVHRVTRYAYARLHCPPGQIAGVAKWLKRDQKVNHCLKITGIHWPEGGEEKGWEVVYHLCRTGVREPRVTDGDVELVRFTQVDFADATRCPIEVEVVVILPPGTPRLPSVQEVWKGADWNEKETWDLVGIEFEGHHKMMRVLLPHDTPRGYHPLQKQHVLRYHEFQEMYDDPQGFLRKPVDEGRVK